MNTPVSVSVLGSSQAWSTSGGKNSSFAYSNSDVDGSPVTINTPQGSTVTLSATGTVTLGEGWPTPGPDGEYHPFWVTYPSERISPPNEMAGALIGAWCDGSGNVILPVMIGSSFTGTPPSGATTLQMGCNDFNLGDNGGSFSVTGSVSIADPIGAHIQSLAPGALIELFELDATSIGGSINRFHAGTNSLQQPVVWQGNTYQPFPVEASGFEFTGKGQLPRPTIRIANVTGLLGVLVRNYQDLLGAKVTRKRTLARYLDAVNFPGGVNPDADPEQALPDDVYFIDRKSSENKVLIEFELASSFDVAGVQLPRRVVMQNGCPWKYRVMDRSSACSYTGTDYFTDADVLTTNPALDACGKRLNSCRIRFSTSDTLPFGGFPSAGLTR